MKRIGRIILTTLILLSVKLIGQPAAAPSCPTQSIYAHNGAFINGHTLPNGPANVVLNNLPGGASGLAIGPSFTFPAPNPTWWTTAGNPRTYWYYNNAGTWTNTGHLCINTAAVNLGGGGTCLYNLVGANGNIYKYTGTGNDFLLTTLVPAFSGQGPYDVVCDLADNFYILKASPAAQQGIYCYNPQGVLTCSWSITGMINQTAGGGFAILNTNNPSIHKMYYNSNGTDYIGNMLPNNTTIVSTVQALPNGGDYASCALNIPQGLIIAPQGGTLTCNLPQIPLVAQVLGNASLNWIGGYNTPTTTPVTPTCGTITWSGPGILSGQGTPTIQVNQPGVYSYTLNGCNTCPNYSITASYTVVGQTGILTPSITAPTCFTGQTTMSVSPNTNTNTVLWSGPGIVGPNNTFTITFNTPGVYTAAVSSGTACTGTATVLVNPTPTLNIVASTNSICEQNFNGSPTTITFTGGGANSYTWSGSGLSTTQTNTDNPITFTSNVGSSVGSVTLVGSNGTCSNSTTYSISIIPNPTITVTSGSMCVGTSVTLTANNASTYTWSPNTNLNTTNGPVVVANPSVTTVYSIIGSSVGCNSQTQNATASVVPNPTITINPTQPVICLGGSINLTANGATNYTWTPSVTLNNTNTPNVVANPTVNTTYTVLGSQNTCTNTAVITVSVLGLPSVTVTPSSSTLCMNNFNGSPNTVTLTGTGATNYTWTSITGLTTNTTNGSVIIVTPNTSNIGTGVLIGATGSCTNSTTFSVGIIPNPTISIVSGSMCIGTNVNLTASGATNYTWSPSNTLNTAFGNIVIANPSVTTVYSIIGNSLGCNSQTQNGTVTVVPLPIISVGPITNTICQGSNLTLNASGATNYTWVPNNYLNTNVGSSVISNPPSTTNYTVIGESNTCTNTAVYQVSVIPVPSILLSASSTTVCENTLVNLTANGANSYYWTPNNVSGSSISQLMTGTTTYSVVGSNGQCIGSGTITISVIPLPNLGVSTLPNTVCSGNSATMTAFGASNYIWTPSSSLSSNNNPVVIATPSVSTNYIITGYNSMDTVVCASTKEVFITVLPSINPIVSPSVSLCQGAKTTIGVNGGTEYLWVPGNYTTAYITVSPNTTTKYDVIVTNQGYCAKTASVLVEVHQQPFVDAGRDTTFNLDEPMHLNATGTGTLTWIFGEGIYCKDCPNTQIFPTKGGCYTIQAVNKYNCTAIDEVCVKVTTDYSIYIPNTFTPNGDGNNDTFRVHGVGIKDVSLTVFDRWGEELFHSDDVMVGWDGYYKFELCKNDVYVYLVKYTSLDGKKHTKTGHVTLMK